MVEGSGLGLAISQKFVQLMGGDIHVESQVGQGSVFTFEIRVEMAETAETFTDSDVRRVIRLAPNQHAADGVPVADRPYRILIAEDIEDSRRLLSELLQSVGFEVREAANGQEALEQYHQWQPHLIWMDMRMPVMDGYEATKRIRELEQQEANGQSQEVKGDGRTESTLHLAPCTLHSVPIIALTASAFEEDRTRILAAGCNDLVRKPFKEHEIFDMLAKHLQVQYVYEEGSKVAGSKEQPGAQDTEPVVTPEALAALPADLLRDLVRAVVRSNMNQISELLTTLRTHDVAVADALTRLADDFRYEAMLALLSDYVEESP